MDTLLTAKRLRHIPNLAMPLVRFHAQLPGRTHPLPIARAPKGTLLGYLLPCLLQTQLFTVPPPRLPCTSHLPLILPRLPPPTLPRYFPLIHLPCLNILLPRILMSIPWHPPRRAPRLFIQLFTLLTLLPSITRVVAAPTPTRVIPCITQEVL